MDHSLGYILRNIQVGVSAEQGGISRPQYPEEVLRETVNNALAHRDYSVNRQIIIAINSFSVADDWWMPGWKGYSSLSTATSRRR